MIAAIRSTVATLTALQSTMSGAVARAETAAASRAASATASAGGTIDRMISAAATSISLAAIIPAAAARCAVASLRPVKEVSTRAPCSTRRRATALPMAPGARMAMVMDMRDLRLGVARRATPFEMPRAAV